MMVYSINILIDLHNGMCHLKIKKEITFYE